jgi:hypothetical protein
MTCVLNSRAQSYQYSYSDPCTGVIKTVTIPINGTVTVYYYGALGTFSNSAFYDGTFEAWMITTVNSYQGVSPCSQIVGITTAVNVTQGTTLNTLSILNSLSAVSDIAGSTNILGGATGTIGGSNNGEKTDDSEENKAELSGNISSNETNTTGQSSSSRPGEKGSSTEGDSEPIAEEPVISSQSSEGSEVNEQHSPSQSAGEESTASQTETESVGPQTSEVATNGTSGNTGGGTVTGGNTSGAAGEAEPPVETETTNAGGSTNITAGSTQTVKGSTSGSTNKGAASNKNSKAPSVVASSDFVGFNFRESETEYGAKFTGGYTSVKWDGSTSHGVLVDYTSALKGPNITGFHAWIKKGVITLASGTLTLGFDGRGSVYGTLSGGQMRGFKRKYLKPLKVVYMATVSYGHVFKSQFIGTAVIAGGMYDIKLGKRIDIKLMALGVYSPYVSYYNDLLLKSPFVALPSIGVNLGITKKFKFNINGGGSWALGQSTLNYTVTCGTRLLIGE